MALDGGEWSASRPGRFTPEERAHGAHWIGVCVGTAEERKISLLAGNPTRAVQRMAHSYTD
jgi:hypothetical protein